MTIAAARSYLTVVKAAAVKEPRNRLSQRCEELYAGLGQAVDWVADVRRSAPRLDRDAAGLTEKLRRSRNLSRRLAIAARHPLAVGVFGMSQAGKSYLISSLARAEHGELFAEIDGKRFDFIGQLNPPGGGKEATGLVTRFTRRHIDTPAGFPVELTLFTEADLIKIIGNSFFNDFDRDRVRMSTDSGEIRRHLQGCEQQRQPRPTGGLDEDAMVDVMDYFDKRFTRSMEPMKGDFWPTVIDLAPRLSAIPRAKLLSLLWGGIGDFTRLYLRLRDALAALANAGTVCAPLEALVVPTAAGYEWNRDSLLNVDVLNRLGRDESATLRVVPVTEERILPEVALPRSVLTALTAELTLVLAEPPMASFLERFDLLDFPGYRGRLSVGDASEVSRTLEQEDADPVAQLLLRGKVAYLFERYTDDQEMNLLVMCTRCDQQIEITDLAPVLDTWVFNTQGETPQVRKERSPGLAWVLTQFDRRLEPSPGQTESQRREAWGDMIHFTLLERFGRCAWLREWADGRPFDHVFLVRKPGIPKSFIQVDGARERALAPEEVERLAAAREMFLADARVQAHVADAAAAWDAVVRLNDGGMERLARSLDAAAVEDAKLARIDEQLRHVVDEIARHRLGTYYLAEGVGELEQKELLAAGIAAALQERFDCVGELLHTLQPPAEQLRQLYLRADAQAETDGSASAPSPPEPHARRVGLLRPASSGSSGQPGAQPVVAGGAELFAQAVMSAWISRLRNVAEAIEQQRHLGLDPALLRALTDELITGADRLRIEDRMIAALRPQEVRRSTTRARIVDQQVLLARMTINGFVDTLGAETAPVDAPPASTIAGRRMFAPPAPIPPGTLPRLPAEEITYTWTYVADWLDAFRQLAVGNVGHSAGREISPEQNRRLGAILGVIRGDAAAA